MDQWTRDMLAQCERDTRERFPEATNVKALWTPASMTEFAVEVWNGDRARVLPWEPPRLKAAA